MAHIHSIYDSDSHFTIDPITRQITNESSAKTTLVQGDHNSERFTFEIGRVEGHDMSQSTRVEVHFINVAYDKTHQSEDVYIIDDMQISPNDDDILIFSWLLSGNATRYAGTLAFAVRFICTTGETVDYAWHTAPYKGISITEGINVLGNSETDYSDVFGEFERRLEATTEDIAHISELVNDFNADIGELYNKSSSLETQHEALADRVTYLETSGGGSGGGVDLTDELDALEGSVTALETSYNGLSQNIENISNQLSQLDDSFYNQVSTDLFPRVETLEYNVDDLIPRVEYLEDNVGSGGGWTLGYVSGANEYILDVTFKSADNTWYAYAHNIYVPFLGRTSFVTEQVLRVLKRTGDGTASYDYYGLMCVALNWSSDSRCVILNKSDNTVDLGNLSSSITHIASR